MTKLTYMDPNVDETKFETKFETHNNINDPAHVCCVEVGGARS